MAKAVRACLARPRSRMSSVTYSRARLGEPLAWSLVATTLMCVTAAALVRGGLVVALPLALLPAFLLLVGHDAVLKFVIGVVSLVAVFGRDLAYVQLGPLYVLDFVLLVTLVLALPHIFKGAGRNPTFAVILLGIIFLTLLRLEQSGLSGTTIRQSVIGLYALWAFIGLALASDRLSRDFARALALGSVAGLAVYGALLFAPGNPFSTHFTPRQIDAAASLYAGFALLAVVFAPELLSRKLPRAVWVTIGLVALAEIGKGETRSIWVALTVAIPATLLLSGFDRASQRGILRFALLASVLLLAAAVLAPSVMGDLNAEQASIYSNSTRRDSVANAEWRSKVGRRALSQIGEKPLSGVGFGPPQTHHDDGLPTDLHNSILGFGLRLGIPGLFLLMLFEAGVLASARRLLARSRPQQRSIVRWLVACQVLTAVHSLFTVVLEGPYMGLFFWILGGVIVGLASSVDTGSALAPQSDEGATPRDRNLTSSRPWALR